MQLEGSNQSVVNMPRHNGPIEKLRLIPRWPSKQAKGWVEAFVEHVCQHPSLAAVVLVGSAVRPVNQVNDVDVLYIYKNERVGVPGRSIDVDLRSYSVNDIESLIADGNDLLGWALRFGYLICEKDLYWTSLREKWLGRLPIPDPEIAAERARKADDICRTLQEMGDIDAAHEMLLSRLTHEARARLLSRRIYPKSRPELPQQLKDIGEYDLAQSLIQALIERE
ncbi:MAG: hypothetical protein ACLQPD_01715 [Desulfomonilaceae bacterium]